MLDRKIAASLEFLAAHVRGRRIGLIRENIGVISSRYLMNRW
jgi:hypothetical protein